MAESSLPDFKTVILKELQSAAVSESRYVSGGELSEKLGISRTAVWKWVNQLRREGYKIDALPRLGYALRTAPDVLSAAEIKSKLRCNLMGSRIYSYDTVESTNDEARRLAEVRTPEGTVVLAESQTRGRGRVGRVWFSPRGCGAWFSVVLYPKVEPQQASLLNLAAGTAVARAISNFCNEVKLKWPNDVLLRGRKVCGILVEISAELQQVHYLILGIGININTPPEEFPPSVAPIATSLYVETGRCINRAELVCAVLEELEKQYELFLQGMHRQLINDYKSLSGTLGSEVKVVQGDKVTVGIAVDVNEYGALLLKLESGETRIVPWGEVSLR